MGRKSISRAMTVPDAGFSPARERKCWSAKAFAMYTFTTENEEQEDGRGERKKVGGGGSICYVFTTPYMRSRIERGGFPLLRYTPTGPKQKKKRKSCLCWKVFWNKKKFGTRSTVTRLYYICNNLKGFFFKRKSSSSSLLKLFFCVVAVVVGCSRRF